FERSHHLTPVTSYLAPSPPPYRPAPIRWSRCRTTITRRPARPAGWRPVMKSDLEIAQEATLRPIVDIAREMGLTDDEVELYGNSKAKVSLDVLPRLREGPTGRYVVITGINPTPLGEGKTLTTVGLAQALNKIGRRTVACIRQPSLGPTFGIKGGA